jgi:hypothetical protein
LNTLALIAEAKGDLDASEALQMEALAEYEKVAEDRWRSRPMAVSMLNLGSVAMDRGDFGRARALFAEARSRFDELGDREAAATCDLHSGWAAIYEGDLVLAEAHLAKALETYSHAGFPQYLAQTIVGAAVAGASRVGDALAVRLLAAAAAMRERIGHQPSGRMAAVRDDLIAMLRQSLGDTAFDAAWTEGTAFESDDAVRYALEAVAARG